MSKYVILFFLILRLFSYKNEEHHSPLSLDIGRKWNVYCSNAINAGYLPG